MKYESHAIPHFYSFSEQYDSIIAIEINLTMTDTWQGFPEILFSDVDFRLK